MDAEQVNVKVELPEPDVVIDGKTYYTEESLHKQVQLAMESAVDSVREVLSNSAHVHFNMCRGIIAPISFDQLAHVLGEDATEQWLRSRKETKIKSWSDLKTDEEKYNFFLSGQAKVQGLVSATIQNDVAMAYKRCSEYRKLQEEGL